MAITQTELDALYQARRSIAMGSNATRVTIGEETTEFGPGNSALLNGLIQEGEKDLALQDDDGLFLVTTSKGFG